MNDQHPRQPRRPPPTRAARVPPDATSPAGRPHSQRSVPSRPAPPATPERNRQASTVRRNDKDGYATAEQIQAQRPQWMIMYGCYSHRFWAYPLFPVSRRIIVHASYPDALIERLDRAEQAYRIHPPQEPPRP